jgi:hypothetical protein
MKYFILFLSLISLIGCQSGFQKFYEPYTQKKFQPSNKVDVYNFSNTSEINDIIKKGYQIIGYSGFTSGRSVTKEQAVKHAKKVGANIVLMSSKFDKTVTGTIPITTYQPGGTSTVTTHSNSTTNASAYGSGGYAKGYGTTSGTSTSYINNPGTSQTNYIPYSTDRYKYLAYFLRSINISKLKLGVMDGKINANLRSQLNTNAGCLFFLVFENTPAFRSDIMDGDVLLELDGIRINSPGHLSKTLDAINDSNSHKFKIWRRGKVVIKEITLNQ